MPQTTLQICNSALIKIGGRAIDTYGGTASKEATLTTARFTPCLNAMIRGHVWAFLKKVAVCISTTTADSLAPVDEVVWSYVHELPLDLGRILEVTDANQASLSYERVGSALLTNDDRIILRYIRRVDPSEYATYGFPDDFAEALACYLAADVAVSLTQDSGLRQMMLSEYEGLIRTARFNGAVERSSMSITVFDSWLNSRDGLTSSSWLR